MSKFIYIVSLALVVTLGLLWYTQQSEKNAQPKEGQQKEVVDPADLSIAFLDIGQGDSTLVTFPNGEQMLVDCAKDGVVLSALGRNMDFFDRTIEYLVITHPDLDHYGGCIDVMQRYDIDTVVYNGYQKPGDELWEALMKELRENHPDYLTLTHPTDWEIGGAVVRFLYPDHEIAKSPGVPGAGRDTGSNNSSVVIKVSFRGNDVLLMGDTELELEKYLIEKYGKDLDVEVLRAGHHGSAGSSGVAFVSTTSPGHVIFSAGKGNTYGHPVPRIVRRFERASSTVWRTDTMGDILMSISDGIAVKTGGK